MRAALAFVLGALVLASPRLVLAQDANSAAADALFAEGRELSEKGSYAQACDRFARSQALVPSVGKLLNLGECHERLGEVASAWSAYAQARTLALTTKDARVTVAAQAAASLEPRVPRLVIAVDGAVAGEVVTRDGVAVDRAALDVPVPVDPGVHAVSASAPGRTPWSTRVTIRESATHTLRIPVLAPATPAAGTGAPEREDPLRHVALGLDIGGGVLVATGLVLGAVSFAKWSSVDDACPGATCPTEAARRGQAGDASTATTLATLSTLGVGVGVASIAAGVVLHLTAAGRRMSVTPTGGASGAGLAVALTL